MNKYTKEEDMIILECISSSPNNLQEGFRQASLRINRTTGAICVHYYDKLKTDPNHTIFMTVSGKKVSRNGKNTYMVGNRRRGSSVQHHPISLWGKLLRLFKLN